MRSYDVVKPGGDPVVSTATEVSPDQSVPAEKTDSPTMADANFAATPYPTYNLGGDDHALLTSHAGASIERNQDAQFSAGRDRALTENVFATSKDNAVIALENRVDIERRSAVSDRHRDRQFAELKTELAVMRAEATQRELLALRADLAETKASARDSATAVVLARIAAKLGA